MSPKKPTIIIAPGAWHTGASWDIMVGLLRQKGFRVVATTHPSSGTNGVTMEDDIAVDRKAIEAECSAGNDVLVVSHSYGGLPVNAAYKNLIKSDLPSGSSSGGVIGTVAVASYLLHEGQSIVGLGGDMQEWHTLKDDGFFYPHGDDHEHSAREELFHDCPKEATDAVVKTLHPLCFQVFLDPVPYAGWQHVPVTYVIAEHDTTYYTRYQEQWVVDNREGLGNRLTVHRIDCAHSPFIAKPDKLVDIIVDAAERYSGASAEATKS